MRGQPITTRVSGDPTATNNGLFYIFSDHLGSTSVLVYGDGGQIGQKVPGSSAGYYPFGSPLTTPTQTITDRNFTGQKENMKLGLIYYNARYYVPTIGKFASADTIVPDPANPQQFNRYAYTLNNPTRFTDPSGHSCANPSSVSTAPNQPPEVTQCEQQAQKILKSTVRIQIHARAFIDGGWLELIPTNSHATLRDGRYLITHNHFKEFDVDYPVVIDEIKLFTAYGDV